MAWSQFEITPTKFAIGGRTADNDLHNNGGSAQLMYEIVLWAWVSDQFQTFSLKSYAPRRVPTLHRIDISTYPDAYILLGFTISAWKMRTLFLWLIARFLWCHDERLQIEFSLCSCYAYLGTSHTHIYKQAHWANQHYYIPIIHPREHHCYIQDHCVLLWAWASKARPKPVRKWSQP